jgi:uncharacterized protein YbgA (DUF1722 family)/uncharacterized protein YbbK (DUF523 family)
MRQFIRPKVVISKCIEFEHCRYDGSLIHSDFVKSLKPYVDFIPVCPEMEIGLGVPRSSIRIVSAGGELRLIQPTTGLDVTAKMRLFSDQFLSSLPEMDGFILKFRSPSCGLKHIKVYSSTTETSAISKASGFFAEKVIERFHGLAIEDEGRLRNFNIREHFLTQLYAFSNFRNVIDNGSVSNLIQFHADNKFLIMAHSQKESKILGKIVTNREGLSFKKQTQLYRKHFFEALKRPPLCTSKANVLIHMFGKFSNQLSREEKEYFLDSVEGYKNKKIPSSAILAILQSWIARFGNDYLRNQTFFEPFPKGLVELCIDTQCEWAGPDLFETRENKKFAKS